MAGGKMMDYDYSWTIEPGSMIINIKYRGQKLFNIFLGEAMETAGRKAIMAHVRECDRTPWLHHWGAREAIMETLTKPE